MLSRIFIRFKYNFPDMNTLSHRCQEGRCGVTRCDVTFWRRSDNKFKKMVHITEYNYIPNDVHTFYKIQIEFPDLNHYNGP